MEIGVTWQKSMLPAVGGDQFGAALAAVPPVAGVADMLAAMMGGAASARPAFPGWPAPANGPPAVPPAGTAAVTPAVAAEVPVGTVPAEAEPGESEPPSRRRRAQLRGLQSLLPRRLRPKRLLLRKSRSLPRAARILSRKLLCR